MKTTQDIEHKLLQQKDLSLLASEKLAIKSRLLQHAQQTRQFQQKRLILSPWSSLLQKSAVSFASVALLCTGTAYASQGSLPGEPLYAVKVNIVEEVIAFTKIDPSDRVAYDVTLMETRLEELKALADQVETPSSIDLTVVAEQIDQHVSDVNQVFDATDVSEVTHEEKIKTLSKISGIAKAQVKISQKENDLSAIAETIQNTEENTSDLLVSAVQDFADDQPVESVNGYLSDQMTIVHAQINASTTNADMRTSAEERLHDVDESLIDGNTTDALVSVLEAQQVFSTNHYVSDSKQQQEENAPETSDEGQ